MERDRIVYSLVALIHPNYCVLSTMHQCLIIQWYDDDMEVVEAGASVSVAPANSWSVSLG